MITRGVSNGWRRGQIILVMSILLVTVIIMVSTIVYLTSTQHLFFNYNPSREIVLSIDADFHRALTRILANTTASYSEWAEMNGPRKNANLTFSYWVLATQTAYAGKGLNIETWWIDKPIQERKTMELVVGGSKMNLSYPERKLQDRLLKLFWYRPNSISAIGADISIDATAQGVIGWRATHIVLLNLTITSIRVEKNEKAVYLDLVVLRENGFPVNDLHKANFEIYLFNPDAPQGVYPWMREKMDIQDQVVYNGGGSYTIRLIPDFNPGGNSQFWTFYYQFVLVRVKDNRGIVVEAYSYAGIEYTIQENAVEPFYPNDPSKTDEKYLLEILPDGKIYWFGWPINTGDSPPIPMPPVKQVRVYLNDTSSPTGFAEASYQAERWTPDYKLPLFNYSEWRRRLGEGSKIAFLVDYPPGVYQRKVRIVWAEDCDTNPPDYVIDIEYGEDEVKINNKVYTMKLKVGPGSYELDYSLSMVNRDKRHTEYALFGYDVLGFSGGYWFPKRLPYYMNTSSGRTWEVPKPGPIRMYAFRNSTQVYETFEINKTGKLTHTIIDDELLHTEIISVAYGVNYFTWTFSGTWLRATTLNYSTYITMINGNDTDRNVFPTNRVKWGTVYSTDPKYKKYINGSFASSHMQHRSYDLGINNDASYSYFLTMYNEYFGTSIFMTSESLKSLESDDKKDQGWIWTSADYARRVMSYDSIYFNYPKIFSVKKNKGDTFLIKAAGMIHSGGSPSAAFNDTKTWANGNQYRGSNAVKIPDMYYRMFTGDFNPTIIGSPVILYYAED
ncbi:MAG: hypothetical protein QW797_03310 [Thermoproteota archaeon]